MDLLYSRYANPQELMRLYIDNGRFGEFVNEIVIDENKRRKEQAEKDVDDRLWIAYVHSYSDLSFDDYKATVMKPASPHSSGKKDDDMTKDDIDNLLNRLFSK